MSPPIITHVFVTDATVALFEDRTFEFEMPANWRIPVAGEWIVYGDDNRLREVYKIVWHLPQPVKTDDWQPLPDQLYAEVKLYVQ